MTDLTVGLDGVVAIGFMGDHLLSVSSRNPGYTVTSLRGDREGVEDQTIMRTFALSSALAELTQRSAREPVPA